MTVAAFIGVKKGPGGVPRVLCNLMHGLNNNGIQTHILCRSPLSISKEWLPAAASIFETGDGNTPWSIIATARYLRKSKPACIISNRERGRIGLLLAKKLSGSDCKIVFRVGNPVSVHIARRGPLKALLRRIAIKISYPHADLITVNSTALAKDVAQTAKVSLDKIAILHNPTYSQSLLEQSKSNAPHEWLSKDRATPALVAVGRLAKQKGFPTLLRAFADVLTYRQARLIILGEGKERKRLIELAQDLGISSYVDLPGWVNNPFAYTERADLFVLSSEWEGSPSVLIEALALGTPVVATDCHTGPREILQDGRVGELVPVGDHKAMSHAIRHALDNPKPADELKASAARYSIEKCTAAYCDAIGLKANSAQRETHD